MSDIDFKCVHLHREDGATWCDCGYHTIMCRMACDKREHENENDNNNNNNKEADNG